MSVRRWTCRARATRSGAAMLGKLLVPSVGTGEAPAPSGDARASQHTPAGLARRRPRVIHNSTLTSPSIPRRSPAQAPEEHADVHRLQRGAGAPAPGAPRVLRPAPHAAGP